MGLADWDARLLSPARALELAGDWPVYATFEISWLSDYEAQPDQWQINLRCRKDGQSVGLLASGAGYTDVSALETSIGDLLSAVVRHMVTAHNLSLSAVPSPEHLANHQRDGTECILLRPLTKEAPHG